MAKEANILLGNIDVSQEYTSSYNISYLGGRFGRLNQEYIDEYDYLSDYDKRIVDMTAQEIIQHVINTFSEDYISGAGVYSGPSFYVDYDLGLEEIEEEPDQIIIIAPGIDDSDIILHDEIAISMGVLVEGYDINTEFSIDNNDDVNEHTEYNDEDIPSMNISEEDQYIQTNGETINSVNGEIVSGIYIPRLENTGDNSIDAIYAESIRQVYMGDRSPIQTSNIDLGIFTLGR